MSRWILKLSSCSSNARMETSTPLSMQLSITLCYTRTHASNRCRRKSFTSCAFCGRLAAPDFVMKCTEARAVRLQNVWKFYGSLTLLHSPARGTDDAQNVSVDTGRGKDNSRMYKKMIMWYCRVYNQIASDDWRYNNPVYKFMTNNKLQLVLITC